MHLIDSSPLYMTSYRKPGGLGSFSFGLMLMLIGLFVPTGAMAMIECSYEDQWTNERNTILLNKEKIIGAYIAKVNREISVGTDTFKSEDFYVISSNNKKQKYGKYIMSDLYEVEIKEKFIGNRSAGDSLFLLTTMVTEDGERGNIKEIERYSSDAIGSESRYIFFIVFNDSRFIDISSGKISKSRTYLTRQNSRAINKYTKQFIWIDNCHVWSVNGIYNGISYIVIRFAEKYLGNRQVGSGVSR